MLESDFAAVRYFFNYRFPHVREHPFAGIRHAPRESDSLPMESGFSGGRHWSRNAPDSADGDIRRVALKRLRNAAIPRIVRRIADRRGMCAGAVFLAGPHGPYGRTARRPARHIVVGGIYCASQISAAMRPVT
jgi:hypothetical protein